MHLELKLWLESEVPSLLSYMGQAVAVVQKVRARTLAGR